MSCLLYFKLFVNIINKQSSVRKSSFLRKYLLAFNCEELFQKMQYNFENTWFFSRTTIFAILHLDLELDILMVLVILVDLLPIGIE